MKAVRRIRIASLFSGAGGLDLGFLTAGQFEIIFANDILLPAAETYSRNFGLKLEIFNEKNGMIEARPRTVLACDVAKVDFSSLSDEEIDVVAGGPPCQDFSIVRGPAWDRRGIEVKRGRLYAHFVRALVQLQPKLFVFENVPGLVSANRGVAYRIITEDFANLRLRWRDVKKVISVNNNSKEIQGYHLIYSEVADFSKLGVPQKRERLIIMGVRQDLLENSFENIYDLKAIVQKKLSGSEQLFHKYPLTPIEVFEGRPLNELNERYRQVMMKWDGVWEDVDTERAHRWKKQVWGALTFDAISDYLKVNGIKPMSQKELEQALEQHARLLAELEYLGRPVSSLQPPDSTNSLPRESEEVVERMKRIPPDENHLFVEGTKWRVEGKGISLVYRRIHPLKPSYTIVAYGGGGTHGYHYDRDRATLTLREKARLQTFPDSFLFSGKRTEVRAQIGEAVPPLAAKRIAEAVIEIFKLLS